MTTTTNTTTEISSNSSNSSSTNKQTDSEIIGEASYYVIMIDRFMSGWGKAEGKINNCRVIVTR